jgi:DNA primase
VDIAVFHPPGQSGLIDTTALKEAHAIEDVVASYGIELKRQGRAVIGRCPFHADGGRPNLVVFPATRSWHCFRCGVGGDVVKFVMLAEDIGFVEAAKRLGGDRFGPIRRTMRQPARQVASRICGRGPEELAALHAAVTLYHHSLLVEPRALAYLAGRGLDRAVIEQCQVGYAVGDQLVAYLRWQRIPIGPALRAGLLTRGGSEFLAGRIVVPDLDRDGQPVWLIGRTLHEPPTEDVPVHLGLPVPKPLLGVDVAETRKSPTIIVVEGTFDYLTVRMWGYPTVATLGTHLRPDLVHALARFNRQFLVLDNDEAGMKSALALQQQLGPSAIRVVLPNGIKDPSELAGLPDGRERFAAALLESVGQLPPIPSSTG